jgi:hypothetical protein
VRRGSRVSLGLSLPRGHSSASSDSRLHNNEALPAGRNSQSRLFQDHRRRSRELSRAHTTVPNSYCGVNIRGCDLAPRSRATISRHDLAPRSRATIARSNAWIIARARRRGARKARRRRLSSPTYPTRRVEPASRLSSASL